MSRLKIIIILIITLSVGLLTACQANKADQSTLDTKPGVNQESNSPSENGSETKNDGVKPSDGSQIPDADQKVDQEVALSRWQEGAHGNSFVKTSDGKNNTCAECHAPVNWAPSMDDIPESCFSCKFEVSEPPAFIDEKDWTAIECKVCHKVDKKGNVASDVNWWLEVAVLEEYSAVNSSEELCMKCHAPVNIPEHVAIEVGGVHAELQCTDCHDAHALVATCGQGTCHEGVVEADKVIPGHDEAHSNVSCVACHDATSMETFPDEETGLWQTYADWGATIDGVEETGKIPFSSHNIALEVNCEKCHFENNPWDLTLDLEPQE